MIDKALDWIEEHCKPTFFGGEEKDEPTYCNKTLYLIPQPKPAPLEIYTLTGLVEYLKKNVDVLDGEKVMVVIESPVEVYVAGLLEQPYCVRKIYLKAKCCHQFHNSRWMAVGDFIVYLQTAFVQNETVKQLLKIVGNIKDESVMNFNDDGVTQQVTAKVGIARVENVPVPNPVCLAPWRTFNEVEQPESLFVFRMKSGKGEPPSCMLAAADGDGWALKAIEGIAEYLRNELPLLNVIA